MNPSEINAEILCIEDETALREELCEELAGQGYRVLAARSSDEAERLLATCRPDIILCDVMIPTKNGFDLLRDLRHAGLLCEHTAFIFLTALSDREPRLTGLRCGADDYLTKPIDLDILNLTIRNKLALVRRLRQARPEEAERPDVHLSPRERQVLGLLGQGERTSSIAFQLAISEHTVNQYIKELYRKFNINSRVEAARVAAALGAGSWPQDP
ncbi:response regulator transcription factor [Albibacillus kandeliae]|uniref:response regulator transcription factor n=1 Tax=Albibacillus kandeliae TaxID=2174228 RepID=UPI000D689D4B|nr:response regulator transcription factor [Albibacillus kandeliae]